MPYRIVAAAAAAVLFSVPVMAADLPSAPAEPDIDVSSDWSGAFIGLNGGYATGTIATTDNSLTTTGALFGLAIGALAEKTYAGADSSSNVSGAIGGGQAGANWQAGDFVFGAEASLDKSNFSTSSSFYGDPVGGPHYDTASGIDYYGTLVGRAGIDMGNTLLFVDGGVAVAATHADLTVTPGGPAGPAGTPYSASQSQVEVGYAVGAGGEVMLTDHVSASVEYQYLGFGPKQYDFAFPNSGGSTASTVATIGVNTVKGALNYHF